MLRCRKEGDETVNWVNGKKKDPTSSKKKKNDFCPNEKKRKAKKKNSEHDIIQRGVEIAQKKRNMHKKGSFFCEKGKTHPKNSSQNARERKKGLSPEGG